MYNIIRNLYFFALYVLKLWFENNERKIHGPIAAITFEKFAEFQARSGSKRSGYILAKTQKHGATVPLGLQGHSYSADWHLARAGLHCEFSVVSACSD